MITCNLMGGIGCFLLLIIDKLCFRVIKCFDWECLF